MKTKEVLAGLERECADCGVKLTYDELQGEGGLCRALDKYHIIINKRVSTESRIRIIRDGLAEWRRRMREVGVVEVDGSAVAVVLTGGTQSRERAGAQGSELQTGDDIASTLGNGR